MVMRIFFTLSTIVMLFVTYGLLLGVQSPPQLPTSTRVSIQLPDGEGKEQVHAL